MKKIKISLIALMALGTFAYAGGDLAQISHYETEDVVLATEAAEEETVYVESELPPVPVVPVEIEEEPEPQEDVANGFYAGMGITAIQFESNCNCPTGQGKDKNLGVMARAGYDFNRYIGIEARGMKTVAKEDGADVTHAGIFIKPMYPVFDSVNIYGLIGGAKTESKGKLQNVDAESLALGAGVELDLSADAPKGVRYARDFDGQGDQEAGLGLFVDYERLIAKDNAPSLDTVSAGVTYDF